IKMKRLILLGLTFLIASFCFAQFKSPFRYGEGEEVVIKPTQQMREEVHPIYNSDEMKSLPEPERTKQSWQKWLEKQTYYPQYQNYIVTNVVVENGITKEVHIAPPPLPLIAPCDKGIGICLLFLFDKFLRFLYTASLAIGVIVLIWAGISYMVPSGEKEGVGKAHTRLKFGIIGVVVAIMAFTIVTAIERGFTEELSAVPPTGPGGQPGPGEQPIEIATINIYTPTITKEGKFTFMYGTDKDVYCDFIYAIYDLDTGKMIEGGTPMAERTMNIEGKDLDLDKIGGHRLRVTFNASDPKECMVSQKFVDLTAPTKPVAIEKPKIDIDKVKIDGTKYIYVKLPENITLSDISQTALQAGAQYYLYNPPFYMRIYFNTDISPQANGSCRIATIIRGVSAPYVDVYNLKAVTIKEFRKYFEFTLDYSKGRTEFVTTIPLSLENNIVRGVYVYIYGYKGDCKMDMPKDMPIDLGFIEINK
ncbi:MAG: pilin, partial [Minisyncoccia bacterium]